MIFFIRRSRARKPARHVPRPCLRADFLSAIGGADNSGSLRDFKRFHRGTPRGNRLMARRDSPLEKIGSALASVASRAANEASHERRDRRFGPLFGGGSPIGRPRPGLGSPRSGSSGGSLTGGFLGLGGRLTGGFLGSLGGSLRGSSRLLSIRDLLLLCSSSNVKVSLIVNATMAAAELELKSPFVPGTRFDAPY